MAGSVFSHFMQKVWVTSTWTTWGVEAELERTRPWPEQGEPLPLSSGVCWSPVWCSAADLLQ